MICIMIITFLVNWLVVPFFRKKPTKEQVIRLRALGFDIEPPTFWKTHEAGFYCGLATVLLLAIYWLFIQG